MEYRPVPVHSGATIWVRNDIAAGLSYTELKALAESTALYMDDALEHIEMAVVDYQQKEVYNVGLSPHAVPA